MKEKIEFKYTEAEFELVVNLLQEKIKELKNIRKERMLLRTALRKHGIKIPNTFADLNGK